MLHRQIFEPFSPENTGLMLAAQQSVYGEALSRQIRYERYCYIEEGVSHLELEPDRQAEVHRIWTTELLDADVDNFQHNVFTANLGNWICQQEGASEATTELVVRSLLVHDLKEYVLDIALHEGDITYDEAQKRGETEFAKEHAELGEILRAEAEHFGLDEVSITDIEATLNDSKLKPPQTEAGQMVELAERIGYMHSGLQAFELATSDDVSIDPQQKNMLLWMAENVVSNQLSRLIAVSTDRSSVRKFLDEREIVITKTLAVLLDPAITRLVAQFYYSEGKDDVKTRLDLRNGASRAWLGYLEKAAA